MGDTDVEQTTGITIDKLVTDYGVPVPGIVQLPLQTQSPDRERFLIQRR